MEKNVHTGHRGRLLEQAVAQELEGFYPHQVLELLLFYAIPRQDTSAIAHRLIDRFGTVQAVLEAPEEALMQVQGVGSRAAGWLKRVDALTRSYRVLRQSDKAQIRTIVEAIRFCTSREADVRAPGTMQLDLTPTGRVQSFSRICDSAAWAEPANLRAALDTVLSLHAKNVIVVVYPGAECAGPDDYQVRAARGYHDMLSAMGITLMDVLLVFEGRTVSLRRAHALDAVEDPRVTAHLAEHYLRGEYFQ